MTGKQRRARLFKKSRPHIRPLEAKDMGWLWAAYKVGSFNFPPELSQEQFTVHVAQAMQGIAQYLVEDENTKFASGKGPVALIGIASHGQIIEPAVAIFKWATPRNVLRGFVAFFQWTKTLRIDKCLFRAPMESRLMTVLQRDYEVIFPERKEVVYRVYGKLIRTKSQARRATELKARIPA